MAGKQGTSSGFQVGEPREEQACDQNNLLVASKHFSQEVFGHNAADRAFRWRKETIARVSVRNDTIPSIK